MNVLDFLEGVSLGTGNNTLDFWTHPEELAEV